MIKMEEKRFNNELNDEIADGPLTKPKNKIRVGKSDKQLEAFEKARLTRELNIKKRKEEKLLSSAKLLLENERKTAKDVIDQDNDYDYEPKQILIKPKLTRKPVEYNNDSDSEDEIIIKTVKKSKSKKKQIIIEESSSSDSDSSIEERKQYTKVKVLREPEQKQQQQQTIKSKILDYRSFFC